MGLFSRGRRAGENQQGDLGDRSDSQTVTGVTDLFPARHTALGCAALLSGCTCTRASSWLRARVDREEISDINFP